MLPPLAAFLNSSSEAIRRVQTSCTVLIQFQDSPPRLSTLTQEAPSVPLVFWPVDTRWSRNVSHTSTARQREESSFAASQQESKVRRGEAREGCGKFEEGRDVDKPLRWRALGEQSLQKAARQAARRSHPGLTRGHRALGKQFLGLCFSAFLERPRYGSILIG